METTPSVPYAERFNPKIQPQHLILGPGCWVFAAAGLIVADLMRPNVPVVAALVAITALIVMIVGGVSLVWFFWLQPRRQRLSAVVWPDGFQAQVGREPALRIAWDDVQRVQEGPQSLVFDVRDGDGARHLVVSAPTPAFPGDRLRRSIGAALDASRGYQSRLCDATGEPSVEAIAHGGCSDPLGCAGSESCALHALKPGVGEHRA